MQRGRKPISLVLVAFLLGANGLVGLSAKAQTNRLNQRPEANKLHLDTDKPQSNLSKSTPVLPGQKPLADDSIIISLRSGADRDKVKEVLDEANGTIVKTLHVNADNYDILVIKPEQGKEEETIKKIADKNKTDKNFKLITRNYRLHAEQSAPNDTYYAQQNVEDMHFTEARTLYGNISPLRAPVVYDVDTGCNTDAGSTPSDRPDVVVYDFLTTDGTQISSVGDDGNGHGTGVCEIMGDVTNNNYQTAGLASFNQNIIPKIVECRALDSAGSGSDIAIAESIIYILNNLAPSHPGPINLSAGPAYNDSMITSLASTVYKEGCLLALAAANSGQDITGQVPNPMPLGLCVVQAFNADGETRPSWSNYANGDPVVAPGYTVIANDTGFAGTSIATPMVSGSVALLMSLFNVTGQQALNTLLATGVNVNVPPNTSWGYQDAKILFRLDDAIASLAKITPPPPTPPSPTPPSPTPPSPTPPSPTPPSPTPPKPSPETPAEKKAAEKWAEEKAAAKRKAEEALAKWKAEEAAAKRKQQRQPRERKQNRRRQALRKADKSALPQRQFLRRKVSCENAYSLMKN